MQYQGYCTTIITDKTDFVKEKGTIRMTNFERLMEGMTPEKVMRGLLGGSVEKPQDE